jgi:hypothetical protein
MVIWEVVHTGGRFAIARGRVKGEYGITEVVLFYFVKICRCGSNEEDRDGDEDYKAPSVDEGRHPYAQGDGARENKNERDCART